MLNALRALFFPRPPAALRGPKVLSVGYKWTLKAGVPAAIVVYTSPAAGGEYPAVEPGIYVACPQDYLGEPAADLFLGQNGEGALYAPIGASPALVAGVGQVSQRTAADAGFVNLIQGYLAYTAGRLDAIAANPVGRVVLDGIVAANRVVWIYPGWSGNNVSAENQGASFSEIAQVLVPGSAVPDTVALRELVARAHPDVAIDVALDSVAAAVNAMPLYSLFTVPDHPGGFLGPLLAQRFHGPLTGAMLDQWLVGARPDITACLQPRSRQTALDDGLLVHEVIVPEYFRVALIALLLATSPAGAGSSSKISFYVVNTGVNHDRPPEIGLAHELVHAYYNARGMQPGVAVTHWSTVAAELLCVGLAPFDNAGVSENNIRAASPMLVPPRTVYDQTATHDELLAARQASHTM